MFTIILLRFIVLSLIPSLLTRITLQCIRYTFSLIILPTKDQSLQIRFYRNGAEKTGLFCVLQVVLERMKIEQDVAIHHVIQQMRSIRPSIIPNVVIM